MRLATSLWQRAIACCFLVFAVTFLVLFSAGCSDDSATQPRPQPSSNQSKSKADFDPQEYLGQGNRYDCKHFEYRWQAQAVLEADRSDPNWLDGDKDGLACEWSK